MNTAIEQLEERLYELEKIRSQRETWLNDLITPIEVRFDDLAKMRKLKIALETDNIIRFPIEKRISN